VTATGNGTGHGLNVGSGSGATGNAITLLANSTNGHGLKSTGAGTGDGAELTAGASGADLDADVTGNITGNLSGSAGSVTGAVGSVTGAVGSVTGAVGSVTGAVGSVTGAVGSVTGNVGGNVTGSVGSVAAGGITAASIASAALASAKFANDTGLASIRSGTAQAGAATTITLDASASAVDDFYKNTMIYLVSGTGSPQARFISGYVGSTKVATVPTWATNPDNTSVFTILPFGAIAGASAPTAAENADALLDRADGVETSFTLRKALRLILAACAGKLSGAATSTVTIRDVNDSKDRLVATVDSDGNRTAVTKDTT
jgi:hypothetical protein